MCFFRFLEVFSTNVKMWQMCGAAGQRVHTGGDASYDCNLTPNTQPHPSSSALLNSKVLQVVTDHPSWLLHLGWADCGEQEGKRSDKFVLMGGPLVILLTWLTFCEDVLDYCHLWLSIGRLVTFSDSHTAAAEPSVQQLLDLFCLHVKSLESESISRWFDQAVYIVWRLW